jgi:YidC/Oxa1 family membrane protein insertase
MSDSNRLFLALILSMGAIFFWNYFFVDPKLKAQQQISAAAEANAPAQQAVVTPVQDAPTPAAPVTTPAEQVESQLSELLKLTREEVIAKDFAENNRIKISTERLHGSINLVGGVLDDITLAKYRTELDKESPEVVLLSPRRTAGQYFLNTGWVSANVAAPTESSVWAVESGSELTPATPVTLKYDNGAGVVFRKTFSIDDKYLVSVKQSVENRTSAAINISQFGLINRAWDLNTKSIYVSHEGPMAVTDDTLNEAKYSSLQEDGPQSFKQVSGWIGLGDKYWLSAIIPQNTATDKFDISFKHYQKDGVDRFQNDILGGSAVVAAGSVSEYSFNLYTGAKKLSYIEEYQNRFNVSLFDRSIDFGSLYFLTKPIFKALTFFHSQVGNMGVAIMLLTVLIRLILFPLANMSYKSMARMKKHMPEINNLRERNKNDKQKQGIEMMKYYKEHKINPAAGCLPIFLQIPVFFSLYKVLYVTIEMRHEPFFWFIHDLSVQDPTNIFQLFGLIAWEVPKWLPHIGILPILFSTTMVLQQKLNPPMADETQKIIMAWMPWIFLFVFANFASGLVIYWIWNNILSILQQYIITRKIEQDKNE